MFLPIKVQATTTDKNQVNDTSTDGDSLGVVYISNETELSNIRVPGPINNFELTNDIEINGNWNPISNFTGTFNGNGHTITFNISEEVGAIPTTVPKLGLFASCTEANIKNLYVDGNISLTTGGSFFNPNVYAGGIVAKSTDSTLENVHFSGNINITTSNDNSSWVGGLVGKATNTDILMSSNTATINAAINSYVGITKAGGLCGEFSGNIQNCYNMGDVLATNAIDSSYAGGIVGNNKGIINRSYNCGKVQSEGPGMNLANIYAGGIVALGETGSSVTDCAVMSPEISVVTGWVNSGYKYIIANGGNKSNNISINNIIGAPTNDTNIQYTQAEMKTSVPYTSFDFYNTWSIDVTVNNGYPYHDRNIYAINIQYQNVPSGLKSFIDKNYISINDIKQTNDGFTLCTKSLGEILSDMGFERIQNENGDNLTSKKLEDWYIYNVGTNYSILKMRTGSENPATAIPFMDFNVELISLINDDTIEQDDKSRYEAQLYEAVDCLTRGVVDPEYIYCKPLADYFANVSSEANYLIAEEYIKKVLSNDRDAEGYIKVPSNISIVQKGFLLTLPDIYNEENSTIKVKKCNLTIDEKHAILVCRTGNISFNVYAAENIAHAMVLNLSGDYMQRFHQGLPVPPSYNGILVNELTMGYLYECAIKADAGIDEESLPKDIIAYQLIAPALKIKFGDI